MREPSFWWRKAGLTSGLLSPLAKLVRWAVTDPLVDVDSPHAYEYLIIAETGDLPAR